MRGMGGDPSASQAQYYQYIPWGGMPGQPMMMQPPGGPMMVPQQMMPMAGGQAAMQGGIQVMQHASMPVVQHGQPMQFVQMPSQGDPKMQVRPQSSAAAAA
jgi:hypothetical protein